MLSKFYDAAKKWLLKLTEYSVLNSYTNMIVKIGIDALKNLAQINTKNETENWQKKLKNSQQSQLKIYWWLQKNERV